MSSTVTQFDRLAAVRVSLAKGHERAKSGGSEWAEGVREVASAFRRARELIPADVAFGGWLREQGLDFYSADERDALVEMAGDMEALTAALTTAPSRSIRSVYATMQVIKGNVPALALEPESRKMKPVSRKNQEGSRSRAMMLREMKLGKWVMRKIKGTSLDSAAEMDELIVLNRGAPEGKLHPHVKRLVARAANGEDISAVAASTEMGGRTTRATTLIEAWRKRMVMTWELADDDERVKFLAFLGLKFDLTKRATLLDYLMEHVPTTKREVS
jgi:hypothetical protein